VILSGLPDSGGILERKIGQAARITSIVRRFVLGRVQGGAG
jgi:hypothetical protein